MNRIWIFILASIGFVAAVFPPEHKKVALIIAIAEYPKGGKWINLSSMNDVKYVKEALIKNGFDSNNIDTLYNKNATKKAMEKALDDLYNRVNEGDIVYFQFSGHGQQIQDDNGDELDGYDEALVPYDAAAQYDPVTYKGENHFRDDLLGEKLNRMRQKIGLKGSLVVLINACHSGTATRGAEIKRGTEIPFLTDPKYKPNIKVDLSKMPEQGLLEGFTDGMGSMVVFSACSPNQPNYEMKDANKAGVGSLSYAFAKSVADLPEDATYYTLFLKMKAMIQGEIASQIPMIEGNTDLQVFSGNYLPKPTIIAVDQKFNNAANKFNDTTFVINIGELNSVYKGTTLKIYETGSKTEYCDAVITTVSAFQSICQSSKKLRKNVAYEAKVDASSAGEFSASLFIQNNDKENSLTTSIENRFSNYIQPYKYLSFSNNPDYTLDISKSKTGGYTVSLLGKGDDVKYVKEVKDSLTTDECKYFLDGIKRSMRVKYLRNMADGGALAKDVTVEIVPKKKMDNKNELIMEEDDEFEIKITNNSSIDYYYTIIDLVPENEMKMLLPGEPQDYVVPAKQTITVGTIGVDKGTASGKETFKIIFSKTPIDLRAIVNRTNARGVLNRGSVEGFIDDLFKDSNDVRATRSSMSNLKVDEVGILSCGFTVKGK